MSELSPIIVITLSLLGIALAVAAIMMPFVVIMIDSRLAKTLKATQDAAELLSSMEDMMRNGK